jgi:hypothetical protein
MRTGLNILVSRYVLPNKNVGTRDELKEASLVVQAVRMRDNFYSSLFHFVPTVTKGSTRTLLAVSAGMGYRLGTRDVSQAYICTPHPLLRRDSVVPTPEYDAEENELWELMHPRYSLPESGEMWYSTYAEYHRELMGMHPTRIDPAVFVRHDGDGKVEMLTVLQVDDSLVTGTKVFLAQEEHESKAFATKRRTMIEHEDVAFNGSVLKRHKSGYAMEQREYLKSIPPGPFSRTPYSFAIGRSKSFLCDNECGAIAGL